MNNLVTQSSDQPGKPELYRLPLAKMGPGDTFIRRQSAALRNALERAVAEQGGKVGVAAASRIHTAAVAFRRYLQVERRLAKDGATLSAADWLALATASTRFKETVDRCLRAVGLDMTRKLTPMEEARRLLALQAAAPTDSPKTIAIDSRPTGASANGISATDRKEPS